MLLQYWEFQILKYMQNYHVVMIQYIFLNRALVQDIPSSPEITKYMIINTFRLVIHI